MHHACPYTLKSALCQTGLREPEKVDEFKRLMLNGAWDFEGQGKTFVYWRDGMTVYISEGHTRANAALEIGYATGDWSYLEQLILHGKREPGLPPPRQAGRFPTRSLWSRILELLGL